MADVAYTRPWVYQKQLEAIFCPERYGLIEATTKAGKTVGAMIWLTEQTLGGQPGQNFWWVAPIRDQAKIVFRRLKRALPQGLFDHNETELTITLGGRVLWFKGADHPDSLYGDDVYAAVIDEATRCKEEAWHAVRSTLTATRGPIRIIGNVKGRKNWAYQLARKAEAGEPDMHYAKLTAWDAVEAGILAREEVEDARRQLPEAVFRELYLAEPSDDGGNPFGLTAIRAIIEALADGPSVVFGVDLAKSTDWVVVIGLDAQGRVSYFDRWQGPWEATIEKLAALPHATTLVDSTGVGDPVLERLQKTAPGRFLGFKFSATSKQQLMEGLAVAIQQKQIRYPDGPIVHELEAFEYEYTRTGVRYTAPEGLHDDCVCALALAVQQWHHQRVPMGFFGGFDLPSNEQEKQTFEELRIAEAKKDLAETISREGSWWPS
jgi:hypothetical protein